MSAMRDAMNSQPVALARLLRSTGRLGPAAERLAGRRVFLVGTGTSWHAANQGAWFLRRAGLEAWPVPAVDAATSGPFPTPHDALVLLTHRGTKRYTSIVLDRARADGVPTVVISKGGNPDADLETVPEETSSAFTVSHLAALLRVAQLAVELGATLDGLDAVPDAVATELTSGPAGVRPPRRLLEFTGVGINAWTAAEGALKTRETSYVATAGGSCEQCLHGPSVALGAGDALVCLEAGDPAGARMDDLASAADAAGSTIYRFKRTTPDDILSAFALTVVVQKIAAECAETLRTNPDCFGKDLPGRAAAWGQIRL